MYINSFSGFVNAMDRDLPHNKNIDNLSPIEYTSQNLNITRLKSYEQIEINASIAYLVMIHAPEKDIIKERLNLARCIKSGIDSMQKIDDYANQYGYENIFNLPSTSILTMRKCKELFSKEAKDYIESFEKRLEKILPQDLEEKLQKEWDKKYVNSFKLDYPDLMHKKDSPENEIDNKQKNIQTVQPDNPEETTKDSLKKENIAEQNTTDIQTINQENSSSKQQEENATNQSEQNIQITAQTFNVEDFVDN